MTREEFNSRVSSPVSAEQYRTIEYVYQHHPVIDAVKGKDQIAQLWEIGGVRIMLDMLPTAQQAADLESAIADTRRSLADLEEQLHKLKTGT